MTAILNTEIDTSCLPDGLDNFKNKHKYFKFPKKQPGQFTFRLLSKPIIGYEDWTTESTVKDDGTIEHTPVPIRCRAHEILIPRDPKKPVKKFWAFHAWHYEDNCLCIANFTQAGIYKKLEGFVYNPRIGNYLHYDIFVEKKIENGKVSYDVTPLQKTEIDPDILLQKEAHPVNLEALFYNQDPWSWVPNGTEVSSAALYTAKKREDFTPIQSAPTTDTGENPMKVLESRLIKDKIDTSELQNYLESLAKRKKISKEDVAKSWIKSDNLYELSNQRYLESLLK